MKVSAFDEPITGHRSSTKREKEIKKSDAKADERAGFVDLENYDLTRAIIEKSVAKTWEEAKREWIFDGDIIIASDVEVANSDYVCLCGHRHLKELCYIRNTINENTALVGNCCVRKFLHNIENTNKIFAAIRDKRLNKALIDYAFNQGFINEEEYNFLDNIWRKKESNLSTRQKEWKVALLERILDEIEKKKHSRVIDTD